jgi:hypothetical protein
MAKKKNTLVAVLGGCAQLMWLSSGCHTPPALTDPLHSFLLLLWSIVWLEKYTFNAFAIDSIRKVGIAGRCNCKERRLEID